MPYWGNRDGLEFKLTEVLGPEVNNNSPSNTIYSSNSSVDDINDEDKPMTLQYQILFQWERRKEKVEHDYSISGLALSVMPAVLDDFVELITGVQYDAIKRVITKLHEPPCPNERNEIQVKTIGDIVHMLWLEYKDFQYKTGTFDKESIWFTNTVLVGKYHV